MLLLLTLFLICSSGKEQFYAGNYQGNIDVKIYSFEDNDLTGSYTQDIEWVSFKILNDEEGDYFTWTNCLVSQGVN